jgi:hypothetical protein
MLSLRQALTRRGAAGVPLPVAYPSLERAGISVCRSSLTLVVGPPSAGKSFFLMNMLGRWPDIPALALPLDSNELDVSARMLSVFSARDYGEVKQEIIDGSQDAGRQLHERLPLLQCAFAAPDPEAVRLQSDAYEARYGLPPAVIVLDNLGNQVFQENEWPVLKALTLEYDAMAKELECAFIATHHTTDLESAEPAQRSKILGKISQYAALILSVGYNPVTMTFKVAAVKNRGGISDVKAIRPVVFHAEPGRMLLSEELPHPQLMNSDGGFPAWWNAEDGSPF